MTNQAVKDKTRADLEDSLSKQWTVPVRILDSNWIVTKVFENNRFDLAIQTLGLNSSKPLKTITLGPSDTERLAELEALDTLIENSSQYQNAHYQLAEDCLQTALLARGLNRSRAEIDGRFMQAERIARQLGDTRQLQRFLYQRAWTAYWWFNDFAELDALYDQIEVLSLDSLWAWDLERLVHLWTSVNIKDRAENIETVFEKLTKRTNALQKALFRVSQDIERPTKY